MLDNKIAIMQKITIKNHLNNIKKKTMTVGFYQVLVGQFKIIIIIMYND